MRFSQLLPMAFILMAFSSTSQAIELNCATSFGEKPPVKGHHLHVQDDETGVAKATLQMICPSCRLPEPEKINFIHIVRDITDPKDPGISKAVYLSDKGVVLTMKYVPMLAARQAYGTLVNSNLNNGEPILFDCKF